MLRSTQRYCTHLLHGRTTDGGSTDLRRVRPPAAVAAVARPVDPAQHRGLVELPPVSHHPHIFRVVLTPSERREREREREKIRTGVVRARASAGARREGAHWVFGTAAPALIE